MTNAIRLFRFSSTAGTGLIVAAAGNDNGNGAYYPAYDTNVIAVASTGQGGNWLQRSSFSNYGDSWITVSAPGSSIYSTYMEGGYGYMVRLFLAFTLFYFVFAITEDSQ